MQDERSYLLTSRENILLCIAALQILLTFRKRKLKFLQFFIPLASAYLPIHIFLYHFLCITGVFANLAIVVVLLRPAMRRNHFNTFLIAVAICDMTLMASYFIFKQVTLF